MRHTLPLLAVAVMISLSACQTAPRHVSDAELEQIYNRALGNQSSNSVQTYSLDGGGMASPIVSAPSAAPGVPSGDSSVTVFPLDESAGYGNDANSYAPPMANPYEQNLSGGDVMARLYYQHGQIGLKDADEKIVSTIANQCKTEGCGLVRVDGHASVRTEAKDEVQRRLINLKVSMERAATVSKAMIRNGIAADAIQVTAHGDKVPPVVAPDTDMEAASRRVEITTGSFSPLMY